MDINEKFCPVCKNKNERNAIVCIHCGASFEENRSESPSTTRNADLSDVDTAAILDLPIDRELIPDDGIAVYVAGSSKPIYLRFDKELMFGRKASEAQEGNLLDLTSLGGYDMGISRMHAVIRRFEEGYELTDMGSTNGTWLNEDRLIPFKPYPLVSGSQMRFGRMRLLIIYNTSSKKKKTGKISG